ncbi:maleylpyruvate isomerase family mycothiol-dependent enzyme [Micromonospora sp. IBHARD004]|uniref:maleylpyruvate isomerase family mycothiol-dependent enzyme n=1 Tax=Micromonospora sp. IBHARD004 TaxID=3457764 RepID=UPI00405A2D08
MTQSLVVAAEQRQADRDQAAAVGEAEGRATLALLRQLRDDDWQRRTDATEWDVRTMVSHLVAQAEDALRLRTMVRRELVGRLHRRGKIPVDAHTAVGVDEHRSDRGPELVERFAVLWPQAVRARRRRPALLRRARMSLGIPGVPRVRVAYLLDVILNRDLWMHRADLARATGKLFVIAEHDRHIVAQVMRDLALQWSAAPVALELTGPAGGTWLIGSGELVAVVRADAVAYLRALAGRDDNVDLELVSGDAAVLTSLRQARIPF